MTIKDRQTLNQRAKALRAELRAVRRQIKALMRRELNRLLAVGLRNGDPMAAKRMLARRAGKTSARRQREQGWPNLRKAWNARRSQRGGPSQL